MTLTAIQWVQCPFKVNKTDFWCFVLKKQDHSIKLNKKIKISKVWRHRGKVSKSLHCEKSNFHFLQFNYFHSNSALMKKKHVPEDYVAEIFFNIIGIVWKISFTVFLQCEDLQTLPPVTSHLGSEKPPQKFGAICLFRYSDHVFDKKIWKIGFIPL